MQRDDDMTSLSDLIVRGVIDLAIGGVIISAVIAVPVLLIWGVVWAVS